MNALEISETKAAAMNKLEDSAIKIMQEHFDGKRPGSDEITNARCVMSIMKGNRQTTTAYTALKFNMVQAMTDDPKVMKKYVGATQPEIKKLIG